MSRWMKISLGITIAFVTLLTIGFIVSHPERTAQTYTSGSIVVSGLCPIGNTSTSFCIVKDGKPYYFAVEGWELPLQEEIENLLVQSATKGFNGLYVWLKVRTNLDLEFDGDNDVDVRIGEQYKPVLFAEPWLPPIKRGKDVLLLPYWFSPWGRDIAALLKAKTVRLYFDVSGYYDVLPTNGCIGEICFTPGHHGPGFYVNFTPPPTLLRVLDIEGKCIGRDLCLYDVKFELRGGYLILHFFFNETTGRKSYADFPIHINVYVEKNGRLLLTDEHFPSTVVPPLPPNVIDVWKEPEHEYIATIIPPGTFTLVFEASGAIYPEPLFSGTTVIIGTPWGGTKIEPKIEVVKIVNMSATTYENKVLIKEINVTLRNTGKVPVVIPQAYFSYDIPSHYTMLKGKIDSTDLIYVTWEANGCWDKGGVISSAIVVNPGETVTVPLTPVTTRGFGIELPLEALNRNHVIEIESAYTNTSCSIVIPPLKVKMNIHNVTKPCIEGDRVKLDIHLLISNNWIMPINTEWIKVYLDNKTLDRFYYSLPYEEIEPGKSKLIDMKINVNKDMLYKILTYHKYLELCLGLSCLDMPLTSIAHKLGEEVNVDGLAIRILNISVTNVIGVKRYNYLEGRTEIDYYEAPRGYNILVVYIEVRNTGPKSIVINSVDMDDSTVITKEGVFEPVYLTELIHSKNVNSSIIVGDKHLWEKVALLELKPGESYIIALVFTIPKNTEIRYILIELFPHEVVFST